MNRRAFSAAVIILIVVIVLAAVGGIWYYETYVTNISSPTPPCCKTTSIQSTSQASTTTASATVATQSGSSSPASNPQFLFIKNGDVWLANIDGSDQKQLTHDGSVIGYSYVSSTQALVFSNVNSNVVQLKSLDIGTGEEKTIYELNEGGRIGPDSYTDYGDYIFSVSPNGEHIAFGGEFLTGPSVSILSQTPTISSEALAVIFNVDSSDYISIPMPLFGNDDPFSLDAAMGSANWPLSFSSDNSVLLVGGQTPNSSSTNVYLYSLSQNTSTILTFNTQIPSNTFAPSNSLYYQDEWGWQWALGGDTLQYQSLNSSGTPQVISFNNAGTATIISETTSAFPLLYAWCSLANSCLGASSSMDGEVLYDMLTASGTTVSIANNDGSDSHIVIQNGEDPSWY